MEKKEVNSLSYSVTNKLQKLKIWNKTYYHIYNSIEKNNELSTYFLINFLFAKQKQIVIPKMKPVELLPRLAFIRKLQHELVEHYQLKARSFGEEPKRRLRIYPN